MKLKKKIRNRVYWSMLFGGKKKYAIIVLIILLVNIFSFFSNKASDVSSNWSMFEIDSFIVSGSLASQQASQIPFWHPWTPTHPAPHELLHAPLAALVNHAFKFI